MKTDRKNLNVLVVALNLVSTTFLVVAATFTHERTNATLLTLAAIFLAANIVISLYQLLRKKS